jgi:hypothetical protein
MIVITRLRYILALLTLFTSVALAEHNIRVSLYNLYSWNIVVE